MTWYWVENNERQGPVTDEALRDLVSSGRIGADTLVWREGFEGWKAWREVQPPPPPPLAPAPAPNVDAGATIAIDTEALLASAPAASPTSHPAPEESQPSRPAPGESPAGRPALAASQASRPTAAAAEPAASRDTCTLCGRTFARDDLLRFEKDRICATCKPLYLQRLKEGVRPATHFVYAGFWVRFLASFVDSLLIVIPIFVLGFLYGLKIFGSTAKEPSTPVVCLVELVIYGGFVAYKTFFVGRYGATLGKMALKLKIVRPDGGRVTYGRALGRVFAEVVSAMILDIGYIMAAFDEEKRSLHDRICDTRVIRV